MQNSPGQALSPAEVVDLEEIHRALLEIPKEQRTGLQQWVVRLYEANALTLERLNNISTAFFNHDKKIDQIRNVLIITECDEDTTEQEAIIEIQAIIAGKRKDDKLP